MSHFDTNFQKKIIYHHYSIGHMHLWLNLVLLATTTLRCSSRALEVMFSFFNLPFKIPSWYTGRLWLMRLGYYKLNRAKTIAEDWIWILDHSVQIGQEKCLCILGIRLSQLPTRPLNYNDLEPIELLPVIQSNGSIVYQQLESTIKKTGVPREIISDHGSDLNVGISLFIQKHPNTCLIYDIKHKTASLLKSMFEKDKEWIKFTEQCTLTKQQCQQTELAFLAPPNQRSKARYMNIDVLILWGMKTINYLNSHQSEMTDEAKEKIENKLSWILSKESMLNELSMVLNVIEKTETYIRHNGIMRNTSKQLAQELDGLTLNNKSLLIENNLIEFVAQESRKARKGERLLGSSEIIESLFGRQKNLSQEHSKGGFTGLVLSMAAFVSDTTQETISQAMNYAKTSTVIEWTKEKLGKTVQAKKNLLNLVDNQGTKMEPSYVNLAS